MTAQDEGVPGGKKGGLRVFLSRTVREVAEQNLSGQGPDRPVFQEERTPLVFVGTVLLLLLLENERVR